MIPSGSGHAPGAVEGVNAAERRVIRAHRTPAAVQAFLNALPYNTEPPPGRALLRSFRGVIRHRTAHCLEAAITAAVILEQHGYPPTVMSLESIDGLDHVIFIYRTRTGWGSVARSRDPGLHGRHPLFPTRRALSEHATVFVCRRFTGVAAPSATLAPRWFPLAEIPYGRMRGDTVRWLPGVLRGGSVDARFTFGADLSTVVLEAT